LFIIFENQNSALANKYVAEKSP